MGSCVCHDCVTVFISFQAMSLDIVSDLIVKWNVSERNFIWKWPLKKPWLRKRGNSREGENACIYFGSDVHFPPLCLSTHYPQTGQTVQHFPLETRPVLAQPRVWTMISPLFLVKLSYHYSFLDISNMPLPYHLISCVSFVNKTIVAVFRRLTLLVRPFPPKLVYIWHMDKWAYL